MSPFLLAENGPISFPEPRRICNPRGIQKRPRWSLDVLSSAPRRVRILRRSVCEKPQHKNFRYLLAKPNNAHRALAALAYPPTLSRVAPHHTTPRVLHVTQNVDALALRVLESLPAIAPGQGEGNTRDEFVRDALVEMHGDIFVTRCTSCQHVQRSYAPVLAGALSELEQHKRIDETQAANPVITVTLEQLPKCGGDTWAGSNRYGRCGGLLRPEVVWFGEVPPSMGEIARRMSRCDLLLVVGTSSTVCCMLGCYCNLVNHCDLLFFLPGTPSSWFCSTGEEEWRCSCSVQSRALNGR